MARGSWCKFKQVDRRLWLLVADGAGARKEVLSFLVVAAVRFTLLALCENRFIDASRARHDSSSTEVALFFQKVAEGVHKTFSDGGLLFR